jgi:hypothetical protein
MSVELYANAAQTTLFNSLTAAATSLTVNNGSAFPLTGNFRILIDQEIMLVTAVAGNVWTVTRAVETYAGAPQVAANHNAGATVTQVLTSTGIQDVLSVGHPVVGGTSRTVLFVDASGNLAQDEANFNYVGGTLFLSGSLQTNGAAIFGSFSVINDSAMVAVSATIANGGTGGTYHVNDVLTGQGNSSWTVTTVGAGKVTGISLLSVGPTFVMPSEPESTTNGGQGGGNGTGCTLNVVYAPDMGLVTLACTYFPDTTGGTTSITVLSDANVDALQISTIAQLTALSVINIVQPTPTTPPFRCTKNDAATELFKVGATGLVTATFSHVDAYVAGSDFTVTSSVMANVTGLAFVIGAHEVWEVEFCLNVSGSTAGMVFQLTGPTAPTNVLLWQEGQIGSASFGNVGSVAAFATPLPASAANGTGGSETIRATIENGSNAGTVQLQMAAATNTQSNTVKRGSFMRARRIA